MNSDMYNHIYADDIGEDDDMWDFYANCKGNGSESLRPIQRNPKSIWNGTYDLGEAVPDSVRLLAAVLAKEFKVNNAAFNAVVECDDVADEDGIIEKWGRFNECVAIVNATRDMGKPEYRSHLPAGLLYDFQQYNITPNMTDMSNRITLGAAYSLQQACRDVNCEKMGDGCTDSNLYLNENTMSLRGSFGCQSNLCNRLKSTMQTDQDVGGIGVFISYALQILIGLIIAGYIIVKWIKRYIRQRRGVLEAGAPIFISRAWISFLVSFQKTQCWFITALIIAAFIRGGGNNISDLDTCLLLVLSLNGVVLISFTMLAVTYMGGPRSWFNFSIVGVAYILCSVFLEISVSKNIVKMKGHIGSWVFCASTAESIDNIEAGKAFIYLVVAIPDDVFRVCHAFCSLVMVVLFVRQWGVSHKVVPNGVSTWWHKNHRLMGSLNVLLMGLMYCFTLGLGIYLLKIYFRVINLKDWGFGQILAFTLWLPCIADFIQEKWMENDMNRNARIRRRSPEMEEDLMSAPHTFYEKQPKPDVNTAYPENEYPMDKVSNDTHLPKRSFESIAMDSLPPAASTDSMLGRERKGWPSREGQSPEPKPGRAF